MYGYSEIGGIDVVSSMVKDRVLKVACGRRHTVVLTEDGIILATKPHSVTDENSNTSLVPSSSTSFSTSTSSGSNGSNSSGGTEAKFVRLPFTQAIRDITTSNINDDIIGLTGI
jgi:hypothetical protein